MNIPSATALALLLCAMAACTGPAGQGLGTMAEPSLLESPGSAAPPGAAPGTCWGRDATQAKTETVTQPKLVKPAQVQADGTLIQPPVYKTETHERVIAPGRETWFEVPCASDVTADFVASVQRALAARGLFFGSVSGEMDSETRAAIRRFQKPQGLNSDILSLAAARQLGLAAGAEPQG